MRFAPPFPQEHEALYLRANEALELRVRTLEQALGRSVTPAIASSAAPFSSAALPPVSAADAAITTRFRAWEAQARPGSRLPAVALTANVLDSMVQECAAAGFDGHMSKPLRADCVPELLKHLPARG